VIFVPLSVPLNEASFGAALSTVSECAFERPGVPQRVDLAELPDAAHAAPLVDAMRRGTFETYEWADDGPRDESRFAPIAECYSAAVDRLGAFGMAHAVEQGVLRLLRRGAAVPGPLLGHATIQGIVRCFEAWLGGEARTQEHVRLSLHDAARRHAALLVVPVKEVRDRDARAFVVANLACKEDRFNGGAYFAKTLLGDRAEAHGLGPDHDEESDDRVILLSCAAPNGEAQLFDDRLMGIDSLEFVIDGYLATAFERHGNRSLHDCEIIGEAFDGTIPGLSKDQIDAVVGFCGEPQMGRFSVLLYARDQESRRMWRPFDISPAAN
jgi:hypothetical protein